MEGTSAPVPTRRQATPADLLRDLAARLQRHGLRYLYGTAYPTEGVLSVAYGVTVWTNGHTLRCHTPTHTIQLPTSTHAAAQRLADLINPDPGHPAPHLDPPAARTHASPRPEPQGRRPPTHTRQPEWPAVIQSPTEPGTLQRQLLHGLFHQHGLAIHELHGAVLAHSPSHPHTVLINCVTGQVTRLHPEHLGYFTMYHNPHDPTAPPAGLDIITTALTHPDTSDGDPR